MSIWARGDRTGRVGEALLMLEGQGIIDGLEILPQEDKPYRVRVPAGIVHMDEEEASMFALGAVVGAFGEVARTRG
ncbi:MULTISPECIES: hypothetical protein [Nocardiopsis]|uniref:Uncharacterized protein n=2 Tax=Nocardiopsis alba TaxID=53437 RepID=A0A7K2ILN6_9ACTN|nr:MULTISPECIES: hypothetical protein [Nocardiopsis]AFR08343.1 hypothetical protein B005_5202 [Nocardiopsis alba ATCC BAA-2165]MEC3890889.1 hypothetical protein [Nocardiopsis sp. LDBS1602]MYR30786.1 hypothetical protein [Nocardiopsis alba]